MSTEFTTGAPDPPARRRYPLAFKLDAVRRVVLGHERITAIARDLGIARSSLGRWRRELADRVREEGPPESWVSIPLEDREPAREDSPAVRPAVTLQPATVEAAATLSSAEDHELSEALLGLSEPDDWSGLLAESVSRRRSRLAATLRPDAEAGDDQGYSERVERIIDETADTLTLIRETQEAIDRVICSGEMSRARELTVFRSEIRRGLDQIADRIGVDAFRAARARAEGRRSGDDDRTPLRTTNARDSQSRSRSPRPRQSARRRAAPRPLSATPAASGRRVRVLCRALVVLLLFWLVVGLPRLTRQELPVLDLRDFHAVDGVRELSARPPSLFVTFEAERWNGLTHGEQRRMIERVGLVAGRAGYNGAHCTTTDGLPVARWLTRDGVELIDEAGFDEHRIWTDRNRRLARL